MWQVTEPKRTSMVHNELEPRLERPITLPKSPEQHMIERRAKMSALAKATVPFICS